VTQKMKKRSKNKKIIIVAAALITLSSTAQSGRSDADKLKDVFLKPCMWAHWVGEGEDTPINYKTEKACMLKKADEGELRAQKELGKMYFNGDKIDRDYEQSLKWSMVAAEAGDVDAKLRIAEMHEKGLGVNKDTTKAFELYKKMAKMGNVESQIKIGYMHQHGVGVSQDFYKAVKWNSLAAESGDPRGAHGLGVAYAYGLGGSQKNQSTASRFFIKAAEAGHADAQFRLALRYLQGIGLPKDRDKHDYWIKEAAHNSHGGAVFMEYIKDEKK